jgi:hypothetical protein
MRKWLILGAIAAVLFFTGIVIALLLPRSESPVNSTNVARIQLGQSEAEVEEILGGPPGDYRRGSRSMTFDVALDAIPPNVLKRWRGDEGLALIQFDPDGRVIAVDFARTPALSNSFIDRLLDIFGL